ncbi:hypothetical protein [Pelagerythrobacter sp.]|uniref:hypothetical protein n=1 Tax=Pelagerythrobacter sp. TaxID=2800702 RepID=UPI0035AFC7C8
MERRGEQVHTTETEVSGGSKEGVVRWILLIGLVLVIGFLSIIWMTGALTQDEAESQATASGRIEAAQSDSSTDSIVSDDFDQIDEAPEGTAADDPGRVGT